MTNSNVASRADLLAAITAYRRGNLSTVEFCDAFERLYNLEVDKHTLAPADRVVFQTLFDEIVWYSPFPDDRSQYPRYRDENAIRHAVENAWVVLASEKEAP